MISCVGGDGVHISLTSIHQTGLSVSGIRVSGSAFRVSGLMSSRLGFWAQGSGFRVQGLACTPQLSAPRRAQYVHGAFVAGMGCVSNVYGLSANLTTNMVYLLTLAGMFERDAHDVFAHNVYDASVSCMVFCCTLRCFCTPVMQSHVCQGIGFGRQRVARVARCPVQIIWGICFEHVGSQNKRLSRPFSVLPLQAHRSHLG